MTSSLRAKKRQRNFECFWIRKSFRLLLPHRLRRALTRRAIELISPTSQLYLTTNCRVVQFNLRVTLGFRLDEYLSSPPINHTVLTSGRVINTALDWCKIKNAIVLSIRVVVVLLVLEGTEAHQPRSSASAFSQARPSPPHRRSSHSGSAAVALLEIKNTSVRALPLPYKIV